MIPCIACFDGEDVSRVAFSVGEVGCEDDFDSVAVSCGDSGGGYLWQV